MQVEPPAWAQATMLLAVVASGAAWVYITPLYFTSGAPKQEIGGFGGAIEGILRVLGP